MSHPELFKTDGTLHDLAIERRLAGELSNELNEIFDEHITTNKSCRDRFEAAQAHHTTWVAPPLPDMPKNASVLTMPTHGNLAANRPIWPIALPAAGMAAAAAAVGLFVSQDIDSSLLGANLGAIPAPDINLSLQLDEGIGTLSVKQPGHVAVIKVGREGSLTVLVPDPNKKSIAIDKHLDFQLNEIDKDERVIAVQCDVPFNVENLFEAMVFQSAATLPPAPKGCIFAD